MKFTLSWLKDHLDTQSSAKELADTLTMIGLEVESVEDKAAALATFTVAEILEAKPHPNAGKLQICRVKSDVGELQIVCGAPNARAGLKVVLAKEGAVIPNGGMVIKKTKIRDVESNGMLCSATELALGEDSQGIIELPQDAKIGESIVTLLGLNDPVFDVNVTPNRSDGLSVRGIARDLSAAAMGALKPLGLTGEAGTEASKITVSTQTSACSMFIGCTIKGVKNGPSPDWMQKRLTAIGLRPISALVDITNYFTYDLGRPLHVYDIAKLKGNIAAREAKNGEKLKALNGKDYELASGMCVIADDSGALGLGGIVGGEPSSVSETTTDVFLEVALFDPSNIAQTGRKLDILSDARYRFERGVDPAFVEQGAKLAIEMIVKLCGGTPSALTVAGKAPEWKRSIPFKPEWVDMLGGVSVTRERSMNILKTLGFESDSGCMIPPSWRPDVEGPADLIEEVLRIHGYDHIPATPLPRAASVGNPLPLLQQRAETAKNVLASRGMQEVVSFSFVSKKDALRFGDTDKPLELVNPISADLDAMRPSLLPNLLGMAQRNANRGFSNLALFEVGLEYHGTKPEDQKMIAAGIQTGAGHVQSYPDSRFEKKDRALDAFDAKAHALAVLETLGVNTAQLTVTANASHRYHPGRSGTLSLGGKVLLASFGELHPALRQFYEFDKPVIAFEIYLDNLPVPKAKGKARAALTLSDFQAVERDFAFTVDDKVTAQELIRALNSAEKQLLQGVEVFDVYSGKGVDAGKKSVALRVKLQAADRTLTDAEIKTISDAMVAAAGKLGAVLRA